MCLIEDVSPAGEVAVQKTESCSTSSGSTSNSSRRRDRISLEEVQKHTTKDDCWIIANGKVYDVTSLMDIHPGGHKALVGRAGQDATRDYGFHSRKGQKMWNDFFIGKLASSENSKSLWGLLMSLKF
eukprot:gb/GFBE01055344.1/.p1 GENE.gb/GFBE01055344.1/~~gb/GFBE01055344.1/.p1  ORF type:complete len:127 (+),score=35.50 gb/GFBE01055344.1/:1-381(+)